MHRFDKSCTSTSVLQLTSNCPETSTSCLFPGGPQAEEVGPRTDHAGPCLVLLKGVTLPRADFEAWLRDSVMEWAVMRVYWIKQRCADRQVSCMGPGFRLVIFLQGPNVGDALL